MNKSLSYIIWPTWHTLSFQTAKKPRLNSIINHSNCTCEEKSDPVDGRENTFSGKGKLVKIGTPRYFHCLKWVLFFSQQAAKLINETHNGTERYLSLFWGDSRVNHVLQPTVWEMLNCTRSVSIGFPRVMISGFSHTVKTLTLRNLFNPNRFRYKLSVMRSQHSFGSNQLLAMFNWKLSSRKFVKTDVSFSTVWKHYYRCLLLLKSVNSS